MKSGYLALFFVLTSSITLWAKRVPPPTVNPVIYSGTEYSAHGDGKLAWVVATDAATSRELWRAKIFRVHPHFWKGEEDNQWVYISNLELVQNKILATDERKRCYLLDLVTKHVSTVRCANP